MCSVASGFAFCDLPALLWVVLVFVERQFCGLILMLIDWLLRTKVEQRLVFVLSSLVLLMTLMI